VKFRGAQLLYFVTVAEEGRMTRAAAKLHVAQPALSRSIAQLESDLGLQLFERHSRGVTLTPAGATFLEKARLALAAYADAAETAHSLARAAAGEIELGFVGFPIRLQAPDLLDAFAAARPHVDFRFHELQFPSRSTASWLGQVDIALSYQPPADPDVRAQALRAEPRVVLAPKGHPLAKRSELTVAEVLDETFLGVAPSVEPAWAGFWSLDDHRGNPAPHLTAGRASNSHEMFAMIAEGRAITTVPASQAAIILSVLSSVVAIPLRDAKPLVLALIWRLDHHTPLIGDLVAVARNLAEDGAPMIRPSGTTSGLVQLAADDVGKARIDA
jgi:DNA-binding transcriptional LysR family regulator